MQSSDEKFLEILLRHGLSAELTTMPVAMNRTTFGGRSSVTFYGVGQPIPSVVADAIKAEVFPLIQAETPDFGAVNGGATISEDVLPVGSPAKQQADFGLHCSLLERGR